MASATLKAAILLALTACAVAQPWPNCPLTGRPPAETTGTWTRCLDASKRACCADCKDVSIGLAMVSSNVSNILNFVSPVLLPVLKGTDINFCTAVYPSAACQDNLEQLACAMTCNPDSGNYISVTNLNRDFTVCSSFADKLVTSCNFAQVTGNTATTNQTFWSEAINPKYMLPALFNAVTGILGIPRFNVITANTTDGTCYNGPVTAPAKHVCCDDLTPASGCPASTVDLNANPGWAANTGRTVDNNTCRAADAFPLAPLAPLPPPPPAAPSTGSNLLSNTTNGAAAYVASASALLTVLAASTLALLA